MDKDYWYGKDNILTALREAEVEVAFRLEDVIDREERPHPIVAKSVASTLEKIERATSERIKELEEKNGKPSA